MVRIVIEVKSFTSASQPSCLTHTQNTPQRSLNFTPWWFCVE